MTLMAIQKKRNPRILVSAKLRYFGDSVVATAFLRHLHAAIPGAIITLLTCPAAREALQGTPAISDFWTETPSSARGMKNLMRMAREARQRNFDAAFLLNRSLQSAAMARLAAIPIRIGHSTEYRSPLLTKAVPYDWNRPDRECLLDLLRTCDIPAVGSMPELSLSQADIDLSNSLLTQHGLESNKRIAVLKVGANDPDERMWDLGRFADVVGWLHTEADCCSVLLGNAAEHGAAEAVRTRAGCPAHNLCGVTSLRSAMGIIGRSKIVVGLDGGLMHVAAALAPASVGLYGIGKLTRWGYNETCHRSVSGNPSNGNRHEQNRSSLQAISVAQVISEAAAALTASQD